MNDMQQVDSDLVELVDRFFRDRSDHGVVDAAESVDLDTSLWASVEELGLPLVGIDEEAGGSGGTLLDALTVNRVAALHAAPLPLAETYLAASLLSGVGIQVPEGPLAFAIPATGLAVTGDHAEGTLASVPWARAAVALAVVDAQANTVVFVPANSLTAGEGRDLAGQPSGPVTVSGPVTTASVDASFVTSAVHRASLVRAAQIAGVLEAVSDITREYVSVREQFGRPVGTFQSVQQHVVTLAQMAAMTDLAVGQAVLSFGTPRESFEVAATKLLANQNAATAARSAHAAHGAIGVTREYRLQQFTRRLHTWRFVDGATRALAVELGRILAAGPSFHGVIADSREDQHA